MNARVTEPKPGEVEPVAAKIAEAVAPVAPPIEAPKKKRSGRRIALMLSSRPSR
jgi:hypothetical protein